VRELRNAIERIMIIENPEIIQSKHLPAEIVGESGYLSQAIQKSFDLPLIMSGEGIDLKALTESFQARLIKEALQKTGGSKMKAAKLLNIDRFALRYLANKYHLS
jgi:transcriptional regulator with PAS, ATPase and Fis domain